MPTNRTDYMREYARDIRRKDRDKIPSFKKKDVTWKNDVGFITRNNQEIPVLRVNVCGICQKEFVYDYGRGRKRIKCNECRSPIKIPLPNQSSRVTVQRERIFGEKLLKQNPKWISLDHVRPDFYDEEKTLWIELKLALKARFWMYTCKSKIFANLFFNDEIDDKIKALTRIFLPLEVTVLDAVTGEFLTKHLFEEELT